jgi:penicillin-binding protein 2
MGLAIGVLMVAILSGYGYAQIVRADHYRRLAENNRLREAPVAAPRGLIEDRRGALLVENVPSYNLLFDRSLAVSEPAAVEFAAAILDRDALELGEIARRGPAYRSHLIAEDLDLSQVARFEASLLEHPEFRVEVQQRRLYRHGSQTAHLLGYLGEVRQEELDANPLLRPGKLVGREGIERHYDQVLQGTDGWRQLIVDSRGRPIEESQFERASPGATLRLTIDLELQQEAELALGNQTGTVIALDPRDGAVRALYSSPSFDPNLFASRLDVEQWRALMAAPHDPLHNRVLHSAYPPGSVFKIVMALAGLQEGVIDPKDRVYCSGSIKLFDRPRRCHLRGGHGWVDLKDAIRRSCDVYFYVRGNELGLERIARYARALGLGAATGIDLVDEKSGLVPSQEWARTARGAPWQPGETISLAIGQGPILTTPLQIAVMTAAVANGGHLVVPRLVAGPDLATREIAVDARHLETVRDALWAVVNQEGSGARARLPGIAVAGKTGTAQVIEQKTWTDSADLRYEHRDHAWFTSYAPAAAPELVVVVLVEHGGQGSRAAAPIARALYAKYFELRGTT